MSSTYEDIFFYLDLTKDILKKKEENHYEFSSKEELKLANAKLLKTDRWNC
jgi:hypothetical protein